MNKDEQRMANIKDRCLKGCKKALREADERVSELIAENARLNDLLHGSDCVARKYDSIHRSYFLNDFLNFQSEVVKENK